MVLAGQKALNQTDARKQPIIWWYLVLSCFYYYSFVFSGLEIIGYAIFYGIPLLYLCYNYRYLGLLINAFKNSWLKYFAAAFFLFCLAAFLIPLFHATGEFTYLTDIVSGIFKEGIKILFLIVVFLKHISPQADWRLFIKYFIWVNICYISVSVIMLLAPPLKDFWFSVIKDGEHARSVAVDPSYVTRYGWKGFSGFSETFLGTIAITFQCFLLSEKAERVRFRDLLPLAALLVGTLFYGRIGFLVSLCVIALFFLFRLFLKRPSLVYKVLFVVLALCALLGVACLFSDTARTWFNWAFAIVINFVSYGRIGDGSTDILFNDMLFIPLPETILFGDGRHSDGIVYYMNTDSGLLRPLLFGGLPFVFLRYLLIALLVFAVFPLKGRNRNGSVRLLFVSLLMVLLLFEIKGEVVEALIPFVVAFATMFIVHHLKEARGEPHV